MIFLRFELHQGRWLPDGVSVFTAELIALLRALWWLEEVGPVEAVLCLDSAAALVGLSWGRSRTRPALIGEILIQVHRLERQGCKVGLLWVPAHVGIEGNEAADRMAKAPLMREEIDVRFFLWQA